MAKTYPTLPKLAENGTVVCLAPGPSLTVVDAEYCRGKADAVIAINDAVEAAPWADVLYSSDAGWILKHQGRPEFSGLKVTVATRPTPPEGWLALRLAKVDGVEFEPSGLATTANSGGAAINAAVHLGAKRIVLLGYDLGLDAAKRKHFNDPPTRRISGPGPYETFRQRIGTMAKPLAEAGIEVVNCSRKTRLEAFPCKPLEAVL